MRTLILLAASALLVVPAGAQTPRVRRAFEPSLTTWLGIRNFGNRAISVSGARAGYGGSLAVGATAEMPLSRRTGLMADLNLAPMASQRLEQDGIATYEKAMALTGTVGLAARLRPQAPVFFLAGGGIVAWSKKAIADAEGTSLEPAAELGIGYDGARVGAWNLRGLLRGYVVMPADPQSPGFTERSTAFDWSFGAGARYAFGRSVGGSR